MKGRDRSQTNPKGDSTLFTKRWVIDSLKELGGVDFIYRTLNQELEGNVKLIGKDEKEERKTFFEEFRRVEELKEKRKGTKKHAKVIQTSLNSSVDSII